MIGIPMGVTGLGARVLGAIGGIACACTLFAQPFDSRSASAALAQDRQPTFRAGTEIVSLGVTVSDKKANFLTDLTREDLEVLLS